jgi:3-hydroxybutyryl-CoA dehydratase
MKLGKTIGEIKVGDQAESQRTISESDVYLFCGITGDSNPLHLNEEYAKGTKLRTRVAPGGLVASLGTALTAAELPGPGTTGLEIYMKMQSPAYIGNTITTIGTIKERLVEKNIVKLDLKWVNQDGRIIGEGFVVVKPPKREVPMRKDS